MQNSFPGRHRKAYVCPIFLFAVKGNDLGGLGGSGHTDTATIAGKKTHSAVGNLYKQRLTVHNSFLNLFISNFGQRVMVKLDRKRGKARTLQRHSQLNPDRFLGSTLDRKSVV